MSVYGGPSISSNGLVLSLDGANFKSLSFNTFPKSKDIYAWYVPLRGNETGNNCTVSRDTQTIRSLEDGIPFKMEVTGNDPHIGSYNASKWNVSSASNGQTWCLSWSAKASESTTGEIYIFGANSTGSAWSGSAWYGITSKTINLTTQWQRYDHTITFNDANVAYIQFRLDGPNSSGDGISVWWDAIQLELGSSPTTYNSFYNENGVKWLNSTNKNLNATLINGPIYDSGNKGSIVFDGVNDYIAVGNLGINFYCINCWAYLDTEINASSSNMGFIRVNSASQGGFNFGSGTGLVTGETLTLFYYDNVTYFRTSITDTISSGWHNFCFNWNGTKYDIYIDGNKKETTSGTTSDVALLSLDNLALGQSYGGGAPYFNGKMSIFQVWESSLSESQIIQNFNALRGRFGI